jgi:hypothetical protein
MSQTNHEQMSEWETDILKKIRQLHLDGDTVSALVQAKERLDTIPSERMTLFHRELVMMVIDFAKSLAKQAPDLHDVQDYTRVAFQTINSHTPLASSPERAAQKGLAWDAVYDGISAQQELVRHLLEWVQGILLTLKEDDQLSGIAIGLTKILLNPNFGEFKNNRGQLIWLTEYGDADKATQAYKAFVETYYKPPFNQVGDTVLIASRYLSRMLQLGRIRAMQAPLQLLKEIWRNHPELHTRMERDIPKNIFRKVFLNLIQAEIKWMMRGEELDYDLRRSIEEFKHLDFIGMGVHNGENKVARISDGEEVPELPKE